MVAAKRTADSAHGVPSSRVVISMAFSCSDYATRTSGRADEWFRSPLPSLERVKLFEGHSREDIEFTGGESTITVAGDPEFPVPFLNFRGVPVGIDDRRVAETGIVAAIDIAVAGRGGGQI